MLWAFQDRATIFISIRLQTSKRMVISSFFLLTDDRTFLTLVDHVYLVLQLDTVFRTTTYHMGCHTVDIHTHISRHFEPSALGVCKLKRGESDFAHVLHKCRTATEFRGTFLFLSLATGCTRERAHTHMCMTWGMSSTTNALISAHVLGALPFSSLVSW